MLECSEQRKILFLIYIFLLGACACLMKHLKFALEHIFV